MAQPTDEARRRSLMVELIRRGGTLLGEACPRCGGVQVRYRDRTLCLSCGDLSLLERGQILSPSEIFSNLRELILNKVQEASEALVKEKDLARQGELVGLLAKYVELYKGLQEGEAKPKRI